MDKRILLIEDEQATREAIAFNLRQEGYQVDAVEGGRDGLKRAVDGKYNLVLVDMLLPDTDGETILKELAAKRPGTKVVVITAYYQEAARPYFEERTGKKIEALLQKPFKPGQLRETVAHLIGGGDRS